MRHKYDTSGIVLARSPLGESNALITLLTPGLGLVRARAQGVRRAGAKLAPALATFSESSLMLVRGQEGWRITGAVLEDSWFRRMREPQARTIASRVSGLVLRLVVGEVRDPALYTILRSFFEALSTLPPESYESAEALAALRILAVLGLDAGELPGELSEFAPVALAPVNADRMGYVARINRGIAASGL